MERLDAKVEPLLTLVKVDISRRWALEPLSALWEPHRYEPGFDTRENQLDDHDREPSSAVS